MTLFEFALVSENELKSFCLVGGGANPAPMYGWWGGGVPPSLILWPGTSPHYTNDNEMNVLLAGTG